MGQILTGLRMEIKHLRQMYGRPRGEFEARLNELGGSLEHTVHAVRDIAMGLRPSMLDDLGLGPALEWQAREFARRHDIPVTVDDDGQGFVLEGQSSPGVGLVGMAERAREIGASLTIESTPGRGTSLRVVLPFVPAAPVDRSMTARSA